MACKNTTSCVFLIWQCKLHGSSCLRTATRKRVSLFSSILFGGSSIRTRTPGCTSPGIPRTRGCRPRGWCDRCSCPWRRVGASCCCTRQAGSRSARTAGRQCTGCPTEPFPNLPCKSEIIVTCIWSINLFAYLFSTSILPLRSRISSWCSAPLVSRVLKKMKDY